jgi:CRISPR/Cas system CSM-associated protein Csm4 (group 5 of RAMP superfamily)
MATDFVNITITCKSKKIRKLVVSKLDELLFSEDLIPDELVKNVKDKPELRVISSLPMTMNSEFESED